MIWDCEQDWAMKTAAIYAAQVSRRLGLAREAREDLAQDFALAAWRASSRVEAGRSPRPYIESAIRNQSKMAIRAHYSGKSAFDRGCVRVGDWLK